MDNLASRVSPMTFDLLNRSRWWVRMLLRLWPQRRHVRVGTEARHVLVLFAGTYGDFVQLLPMLTEISRLWPQARIDVYASPRLCKAFAFALPAKVRRVGWLELLGYTIKPAELLFINAAGVYRVRFEIMALRLGRAAAGFRYAHEKGRAGLGWSLPLTPEAVNFAEANRQLPSALAVNPEMPTAASGYLPWHARIDVNAPFPFASPVLFSVGSAGFRQTVGTKAYEAIIDAVISLLQQNGFSKITFVAGPDDDEVVAHLRRTQVGAEIWRESAGDLAEKIMAWPGGLMGFNSFMAHFALYLGRRMVVLHHEAVPFGYDCAPFHHQLVLTRNGDTRPLPEKTGESGFDLGQVRDFLVEMKLR